MKVDDNPFPRDQNMVDVGLFKGKTKVLTSAKSREAGIVDPKCKYRLMNTERLENVIISRKADMSRGKRQRIERQSRELHLESC